jgi:hypothetical protein
MVMQSEKRLAYSLDDFILKNKIKKIKITKIDCEEEDAKILLNSKKAAKICKIIILEKPKNPLKIYFWAKQNNFKILPDCFGKDSASLIFSK